jgi:ABC-2 type transport system ATP-binding protein
MESIINVSGLTKNYHKETILNHLSFQINAGESVALLGENGAGKTTMINVLNHIITKDAGIIAIMGKEDVRQIRGEIGIMMQKSLSLPRITVKECLNLIRSYYRQPLSYEELIDLAQLKKEEGKYVDHLSGGQKRRLTFAAAMASNPQLVFLDEPTAGMDSNSRMTFWQTIKNLKKEGKTFFITSHYLEELDQIADRIMILKDGHLIYNDHLQALQNQSRNASIQFKTKLSKAIFAKLSRVNDVRTYQEWVQLSTGDLNLVLTELMPYLDQIESLTVQQNSLETLFHEVIGGTIK